MYTTNGEVCGDCGHKHKSLATARACLIKHVAEIQCGNPGGRAYSDRVIVRCDGESLNEDELQHLDDLDEQDFLFY